jgi:DNA-binding CsgD family transcriptional regulator
MDENNYYSAVNEISKLTQMYQQNYLSLSEGDIYRMVLFHLSLQSTYLKELSTICRGAHIEIEQQIFLVENKNFDSVHENFMKQLSDRFPNLSKSEKKLCAYLRMDLVSKEIAPLLNISVRGVEISRYRLRLKLELPREVNLTDFLQRL